MATSYSNPGGKGDRRSWMVLTSTALAGTPTICIDGSETGTGTWFNGSAVSGLYVQFDFLSQAIIDEATMYQQTATAQGTWQWQGSNDGSTWTNIGSSFALGGVTTQVLTSLNGNTTGYRYYRLLGVSGSSSNAPYLYEFEFKIADDPSQTYSYLRNGVGQRTGTITVTSSGITFGAGNAGNLIDGLSNNDTWWSAASSGAYVRFDMLNAVVVNEFKWVQSTTGTHGTWQLQGSPDATTWTNIGSSFTLGGALTQTQAGGTSSYRYYQLAWQSGSVSSGPFLYEILFNLDTSNVVTVAGVEVSKANVYTATAPPVGVSVSKAHAYSVIFPIQGLVSDALAAALAETASIKLQKGTVADTIAATLSGIATLVSTGSHTFTISDTLAAALAGVSTVSITMAPGPGDPGIGTPLDCLEGPGGTPGGGTGGGAAINYVF